MTSAGGPSPAEATHRSCRHRGPFASRFRRDVVVGDLAPLVRAETDALIVAFDGNVVELRTAFAGPLGARMMAQQEG